MSEPWNMDRMMDLATGYWRSAVLSAAVELKLFDALSKGAAPLNALAEQTHAEARHLEELLDTLVALGLLSKVDAQYAIAPGAEALLNRKSPQCMLDALRYNLDLYPLWGQLASCIHHGAPVLPPQAHLGDDAERTRRFAMGMHGRALALAPALIPHLNPNNATRFLDIGAGPGTFSRLLAEKHSALRVTQFDLPAVLAVARELTDTSSAASRIDFVPGDYRKDPLPQGYEMALLSGAMHQEDEDTARALLQNIRQALIPGGRFMIVDMMLQSDRSGPLFSNLFSINMMLTSPRGRVFSADHLETLLRETGFTPQSVIRPEHLPYWIIEATR